MSSENKKENKLAITRGGFIKISAISTAGLAWSAWLLHKKVQFPEITDSLETIISTPDLKPSKTPTDVIASATHKPTQESTRKPTSTATHKATPSPTKSTEESENAKKIEIYGKAGAITPLEFHGDNYDIYPGYSMNPASFAKQMNYLAENDYSSVTSDQLVDFLNGRMDLPARSVILTTDSGNVSVKSIPRMIPVLQATGMHFISFIQTQNMDEGDSVYCKNNAAWKAFKSAVTAGVFSIGGHSETHRDFNLISEKEGLSDLKLSKEKIEYNLEIPVRGLSWPLESVPLWANQIKEIGYEYAFGGRSRPILDCSVFPEDDFRYKLPRIFPPNPSGVSGRPNNYTLEDILKLYSRKA